MFSIHSNEVELHTSKNIVETFADDVATLEILHPKPKDTGEYTCVVINQAGEDVCKAKLTVTGETNHPVSFIGKFNDY